MSILSYYAIGYVVFVSPRALQPIGIMKKHLNLTSESIRFEIFSTTCNLFKCNSVYIALNVGPGFTNSVSKRRYFRHVTNLFLVSFLFPK